jgi:hypothetical protein
LGCTLCVIRCLSTWPRHASSEWLQVYNTEVVMGIRAALLKSGMTQNPCLECADAEADNTFIC